MESTKEYQVIWIVYKNANVNCLIYLNWMHPYIEWLASSSVVSVRVFLVLFRTLYLFDKYLDMAKSSVSSKAKSFFAFSSFRFADPFDSFLFTSHLENILCFDIFVYFYDDG